MVCKKLKSIAPVVGSSTGQLNRGRLSKAVPTDRVGARRFSDQQIQVAGQFPRTAEGPKARVRLHFLVAAADAVIGMDNAGGDVAQVGADAAQDPGRA